ncbi:MAG TPA: PIG-L family deacetylase [Solirubrobacteraceae bacterium]|nr:PIG-L family deacetylase [Solirubrobacteraceae bacterium]
MPDSGLKDPTPGGPGRVLVVEDDEVSATILRLALLRDGHDVVVESDGEGAAARLEERWDVIVTDIELPGIDGLALADLARKSPGTPPVLVMTAHERFEYAVSALRSGAAGFLTKPVNLDELRAKVRDLLEEARIRDAARPVVLAIGAHPDDVEIGCGGTLLRHASAGDRTTILTLTGGEHGGDATERAEESRAAAAMLGASLIHLDLPDTVLSEGPETISAIEGAIATVRPTVVYTHTIRDNHQDHRAANRATMVAARGVPNVLCYQSPSTIIEFTPTHFVDVTDFIETKVRALRLFASQHAVRIYLADDMTLSTARYWSRFAGGVGFVEPLEVVRTSAGALASIAAPATAPGVRT